VENEVTIIEDLLPVGAGAENIVLFAADITIGQKSILENTLKNSLL
jgi:hypothetical protein